MMRWENRFRTAPGFMILPAAGSYAAGFEHFITKDGHRLMGGDLGMVQSKFEAIARITAQFKGLP